MQIAFVTDTFPPDLNGVSLTMDRLRTGLESRGHRVTVVRPGGGLGRGRVGRREVGVRSLPVPGYPGLRFGMPSWGRLWQLWSVVRPDVVYIATEGPLGWAAIVVARWLGIPVTSGFHTNFHEYLYVRGLSRLQPMVLRYLRCLHNCTAMTLVPSHDVRRQLCSHGFKNLEILSRGVAADMFTPARRDASLRAAWGVRDGARPAPVFMLVGRLAPEKNLPFALETLEKLTDARGHCVVVGDGPERAALESRFRFARFTGALRGEELARHFASADVLLFPSLTETFGNVLLEGLASGLLTLGFDGRVVLAKSSFLRILTRTDRRMIPDSRQPADRFVRFKTLFLSDVHLGTPDCKVHEVNDLLRRSRCEKLVLNGDIIDAWHLARRRHHWSTAHTRFIRLVLRKLEKENTEVVYLRGNHDDVLHRFLPLRLARFSIVNEHIHQTPQGDYLVVHGDGFDQVTTQHPWIARLGAVGYDQLLRLNRVYNGWRRMRGKEYFSLSKAIKARVKKAISFTGRYEEQLQGLATEKKCRGIICGHIHTPADKLVGSIHYLNSGDWVESLTCIVEHLDRRLEVLHYRDFLVLAGPVPTPFSSGAPRSTP